MLSSTLIADKTVTITDLIAQFVSYCTDVECLSKWTIRTRATHLKQFKQFCDCKKLFDPSFLTLPFMDDYFVEYTKTHSKNTANTGRRILKVFLAWVKAYKEMDLRFDEHRIKLVKLRDEAPRYIERSIIENAIRLARKPQDKILIALAFEGGLRIGELVSVKVSDIRGCGVHVVGKGAIDRTVYITDSLASMIRIHIERYRLESNDFIFFNDCRGNQTGVLHIGAAREHIQRAFAKIGVKMYPHQLRHSLAIELLKNGCDVVTIQHILGHTDLKTTMKYLRVSDDYLKSQAHKYFGKSVL